jgi:hypothetical protein
MHLLLPRLLCIVYWELILDHRLCKRGIDRTEICGTKLPQGIRTPISGSERPALYHSEICGMDGKANAEKVEPSTVGFVNRCSSKRGQLVRSSLFVQSPKCRRSLHPSDCGLVRMLWEPRYIIGHSRRPAGGGGSLLFTRIYGRRKTEAVRRAG